MRVYPRACGGTALSGRTRTTLRGLSPRLRGNPIEDRIPFSASWSIPAPAGEPVSGVHRYRHTGVYPRACGGTLVRLTSVRVDHGLSPRLRGNLLLQQFLELCYGSIPAPAGEPDSLNKGPAVDMVYPRACGGTVQWPQIDVVVVGLSPRLRGNHVLARTHNEDPRSIPAPAGEPAPPGAPSGSRWVYPRACGGTGSSPGRPHRIGGLSPRLRGNRPVREPTRVAARSIPAPAGEPPQSDLRLAGP